MRSLSTVLYRANDARIVTVDFYNPEGRFYTMCGRITDISPRPITLAVDLVALVAALVAPFPLYVVLVLYWGDLIGGTVRRFCQTVVAAPREEYSPTEPPAMFPNGDPNPLRFLTPKLGTVQPVRWLPPVAVHNLKPGVIGVAAVSLTGLVVGLTTTLLDPAFTIRSQPTIAIVAAGCLAVVVKHGWLFRRFVRSDRPPAKRVLLGVRLPGSFLMALPVVAVDAVHAGADFDPSTGFSAVAIALVVGRIAYGIRRNATPTGADSVVLSEPGGRPIERFRPDRRAVWIAGMIDGILPRIELDVLNVFSRFVALSLLSVGGFVVAYTAGLAASVVATGIALVVVAIGFGLAGIVHFELAFGAMEYRLYDDELVAYDARLDAVQWRVPSIAIRNVSVERTVWTGPPGTGAATVTFDRTDSGVEPSPYGWYRQTLAYVQTPERVADRLRRSGGTVGARGADV